VKMKLSMIVCAYNEENSIGPLLENLIQQDVPPEVFDREIIVIASGCKDKTEAVVKEKAEKNRRITLISEPERSGKASALNKAFEACSGDYIALVPADVFPAGNALFNLLIPFRDPCVSAVSGRPMQAPDRVPGGFSGYLANMTYRLWARLMSKLNDRGEMAHCSGEFMAIRSDVKTAIPRDCAADDSYIAIAAKRKGHIKFAFKAVCYNLMPSNLADYINQRRRWLYGHFQTKKMTGEYPTVLDTVVLSKPRMALQVLAEEVAEQPKAVGYLSCAIIVEAIIYSLCMFDRLLSRHYSVWPVIRSTKFARRG
jgi:cellulose synthase/poly-beta-1,6-N-acetylglucosamine synthase-like glycosyltransferase